MLASQRLLWPISLLHICLLVLGTSQERFDEQLSIRTLQDGKVASKFTFTTLLKGASPRDPRTLEEPDESQHYTLFPLAFGQILRQYGVTELHLSLNAGNWNYDRWGYPEETAVGTGAELWAWMGDGASTTIDERWKGLRNALSGLFCASIASFDELRTTAPGESFQPEGDLPRWNVSHVLRHASVPSEHVCTENLTPFLKLLPCKARAGLATLLNPHRLFDADWHGMAVHVLWRGDAGVEARFTFQSVSDPLRASFGRRNDNADWSLHSLFDRTVDRSCPVAETSQILVTLPKVGVYSITPESTTTTGDMAVYDVHAAPKSLNVELKWPQGFHYPYSSDSTPFSVQRTLTGSSQAWGRLSVRITNHRTEAVHALYLETMPWLLQFHLHTLEARVDGVLADDIISDLTYVPSIAHARPTTFQVQLHLPPGKTVQVTMDVAKAFLRYTEHPPDAQRGWDLPPAVLVPLPPAQNGSARMEARAPRMYTSTLLVDLATPDFSMPYNVIIFTCTLIAGIFGTIFNTLTRSWVIVRLPGAS